MPALEQELHLFLLRLIYLRTTSQRLICLLDLGRFWMVLIDTVSLNFWVRWSCLALPTPSANELKWVRQLDQAARKTKLVLLCCTCILKCVQNRASMWFQFERSVCRKASELINLSRASFSEIYFLLCCRLTLLSMTLSRSVVSSIFHRLRALNEKLCALLGSRLVCVLEKTVLDFSK